MDEGYDVERALKGKQKGGRLENWKKQYFKDDGYVVWGNCYDDAMGRFADGTWIHTSLVIKHHEEDHIIETLNSYYIVGKPAGVDLTKKEKITQEQLDMLARCIF